MAAHQAPPSLGFSRQESWSGVPLPLQCVCVCIYIKLGAPLLWLSFLGFARQEYWSGVPLPSPPNVCKHHQKSGCTLSLKKKLSKYLLKLYRSYSLTTIQQNKKISLNNVKTSNQKCWVAISFSGDLPNPGIKAMLLLSPALAGGFFAASASHFHIKNKIHNYKDVSTPLSD